MVGAGLLGAALLGARTVSARLLRIGLLRAGLLWGERRGAQRWGLSGTAPAVLRLTGHSRRPVNV